MKSRRAAVMSAPVVAMDCFCWPWPGGCGWCAHDVGDCRCRGMGWPAWEGKIKLSTCLWAYSQRWREGAVQVGVADGMAQQPQYHIFSRPLLHGYSHILLDSFDA